MSITHRDVEAAEDAARAHLFDVRDPRGEGWVCADCDEDDEPKVEDVRWLWRDDDGGAPLCHFHADERIHEAIPYGANCSGCGKRHCALWPDGEPLFEEV